MKPYKVADDKVDEIKETLVVKLEKSLLPKMEVAKKEAKGKRI